MTVREEIDAIKKALSINRDEDLAVLLGIGQSGVSAWIRHGNIPAKHILKLNDMIESAAKGGKVMPSTSKGNITKSNDKTQFYGFKAPEKEVWLPERLTPVSHGKPSWRGDDSVKFINATKYLHDGSFFVPAKGNSMEGAKIYEGMRLLIDTEIEPMDGHIVLASVDGEDTVKRLRTSKKPSYKWTLYADPDVPEYPPIECCDDNIKIIGVVIDARWVFVGN